MNTHIKAIWDCFAQICAIPHASGREDKIRAFLIDFAGAHNLSCSVDKIGNVVIRKPASAGYEGRAGFVLQAHMDMVCEKNEGVAHDFDRDPIQTEIAGDWLQARGTTLGADNGIGMAMALVALSAAEVESPALECLFTVDEEKGLVGASQLQADFLRQPVMLNLDTEEEGEFCIGCAGGTDTIAEIAVEKEETTGGLFFFNVKISGLQGGHSGTDIDKKRGNAIKILAAYLKSLQDKTELRIAGIRGGNLRNAIPREAEVLAALPFDDKELVRVELNHFIAEIEQTLSDDDKDFRMDLQSADAAESVFTKALSESLINVLHACPHGVIAMNAQMPALVETSTNLAAVRVGGGNITIETSQRSACEDEKEAVALRVAELFAAANARIWRGKDYPGWTPNLQSPILQRAKELYRRLFDEEAKVTIVHAGLECGIISKKYPSMDIISFGPTIQNPHSPSERVQISSVAKSWNFLVELLKS